MKKLIAVLLAMLLLGTWLLVFAETSALPQGIVTTQEQYADLIATAIQQSEYTEEQIDKEHIFIIEHTSPNQMRNQEDAIWLYVALPILGTSDISYAHFDEGEYVMAITNFAALEGMQVPYGNRLEHYLKANYLTEPTEITNVWVGERVHVFAYKLISGGLEYIIPYYFASESSFNVMKDESCNLELGRAYLTDDFLTICELEADLYDEYRSANSKKEDSYTHIDNEGEVVVQKPEATKEPLPTEKPEEEKTDKKVYSFKELTGISKEDIHHIAIGNGADGIYYSTAYDKVITEIYNAIHTKALIVDDNEDIRGGFGYRILFFVDEDTPYNEAITYTIPHGIALGEHNYIINEEETFQIAVEKVYELISNDCSDWASDSVTKAKELGFLEGLEDLFFKESVTREQFCEIIYNMLMNTETVENAFAVPAALPFKDTYSHKVSTLYYAGIVQGKGDRLFAPDDFLTREEAATILYRVAEFLKMEMPQSAYLDGMEYYADKETISAWAFDAVFYMRELGIMIGTSDTEFSPKATYTLEQAVATVVRLYEHI